MQYLAVEWLHSDAENSVRLYHELDDERYERRKVDEYRDGTLHFADAKHSQGSTFLAWEPLPSNEEIAADPQFQVSEITAQDFERIWSRATQSNLAAAAR